MADHGALEEKTMQNQDDNTREKRDWRILLFFSIWVVVAVVITIPVGIILGMDQISTTVTVFITNMVVAFLVTGLLSYKYNAGRGIIPTKRVFKGFAKISAGSAPAFAALLLWTALEDPDPSGIAVGSTEFFAAAVGLFMGMFMAVFCSLLTFLLIGFGMVAVLSILIRRKTPDMLVEITKITPNITEDAKKRNKRKSLGYSWLAWAFGIPDVLDTRTLTINRPEPVENIPWKVFRNAVKWQLFFGIVLLVYISFSPFLLDYAGMQELASIASITTTFIPMFILPWYVYLRLDAKIQGPVKDFKLFTGLSSRMFQTIVAFGTMLLCVRLAIRNPAFVSVIYSFLIYSLFFVTGILIFTFVYFNYFENDLAQDIARKYKEIREP